MILGFVMLLVGVSVDPKEIALKAHETKQLTASVKPENATNKNVSWTSSNELIATISQAGLVTAVAEGQAVITVTTLDGGKTDTCTVTVSNVPVGSYTVSGTVYISVGDVKTPIADATVKLYNASGEVISEKTADADGMYEFTGVADGGYKITAEAVGYRAGELDVTVDGQDKLNQDIALKPETGLYSIYGDVLDAESGVGLAATVKLWKQGTLLLEEVADEKGYYEFTELEPGENYKVVASMEGYTPFEDGKYVNVLDTNVPYEVIYLESESTVPVQLRKWVEKYEFVQNMFGTSMILVTLKTEWIDKVTITYDGNPFTTRSDNHARQTYNLRGLVTEDEIDKTLLDGLEAPPVQYEIINLTTSYGYISPIGTYARIYLDSSYTDLNYSLISVMADGRTLKLMDNYYHSGQIAAKVSGDPVNVQVYHDGALIEDNVVYVR